MSDPSDKSSIEGEEFLLVIPDIHQDIEFAKYCLNQFGEKAKNIIYLGDFFDSFFDPPYVYSFENTCHFYRSLLSRENELAKKSIVLLGNHDIKYIYENTKSHKQAAAMNPRFFCSGVTKNKVNTFRKCFFSEDLKDPFFHKNIKIAHQQLGWTFSHAGIIDYHIPPIMSVEDFIDKYLTNAWMNFRNENTPEVKAIEAVGAIRYGRDKIGSILWLDWRTEFYHDDHIGNQIVGHTTCLTPESKHGHSTSSYCIDCNQKWFATITKDKITVHKIPKTTNTNSNKNKTYGN